MLLKPQENVNGQDTKWLSTGERWVGMCVCTNMDQWRPPTWASCFLHSWVCCWCCCRVALACLSRLLTSRWRSWTRLSFSALCCCCSRVLSCSCCMRCSAIWLDKQAKRDFISQHTLRATLSSWQLVHPAIHSTFLHPIPSTPYLHLEHPTIQAQPHWWNWQEGREKKARKVSPLPHIVRRRHNVMCLHLTCTPPSHLSWQLYRPTLNVPLLSLFKSVSLALFCVRHIKEQLVWAMHASWQGLAIWLQ